MFGFNLYSVLFSMACAFKKRMVVLDAAELFSCMWPEAKAV